MGPQVDAGPALLPCKHSPDWQSGPNRLGSWHSWQAEPRKFSWWWRHQVSVAPLSLHPTLASPYLAHAGPIPVHAIQAGPVAIAWGLSAPRAFCEPPQNSALCPEPSAYPDPSSSGQPQTWPFPQGSKSEGAKPWRRSVSSLNEHVEGECRWLLQRACPELGLGVRSEAGSHFLPYHSTGNPSSQGSRPSAPLASGISVCSRSWTP